MTDLWYAIEIEQYFTFNTKLGILHDNRKRTLGSNLHRIYPYIYLKTKWQIILMLFLCLHYRMVPRFLMLLVVISNRFLGSCILKLFHKIFHRHFKLRFLIPLTATDHVKYLFNTSTEKQFRCCAPAEGLQRTNSRTSKQVEFYYSNGLEYVHDPTTS